jgi:hypothetical protein
VIDSKIVFINFSILNTIYGPIRIVHLNSVPIHIQINVYLSVHTKKNIKQVGRVVFVIYLLTYEV